MDRRIYCIYDIRLIGKSALRIPDYALGDEPQWVWEDEILNAIESSSLGRIQHNGNNVSIIPTGIQVTSLEGPAPKTPGQRGKPAQAWELNFKLMHQITKLDEVGQLCELLDGTAVISGLRGADFLIQIDGLELFDYPESDLIH
jgi:hypothetical protein